MIMLIFRYLKKCYFNIQDSVAIKHGLLWHTVKDYVTVRGDRVPTYVNYEDATTPVRLHYWLDAEFEKERKVLEEKGLRWRFVASMDKGKTKVSLETVAADHPFYQLEGSNNIVLITTGRYHDYPMMIRGYGAGASVTAAGVFANVMAVSN